MEDINGYQPDEEPPLSSVLPPVGGLAKDTGEREGKMETMEKRQHIVQGVFFSLKS